MKKYFGISLVLAAVVFAACNNSSKTEDTQKQTEEDTSPAADAKDAKSTASAASGNTAVQDILSGYLQIKNSLASDNGNDAANGGKAIAAAIIKIDTASFTVEQKKMFSDVQDDLKENAEHIGDNAGKIDHQREHFDMLSQDMYDFVKVFSTGQALYKDFCPMYNNGKGAFWISEIKDIKNPYLGKKMPTCGEVKEEIK